MWIEETKSGKYKAVERYTDYLTGKQKRVSVTLEKNTAQSRKAAQIALQQKINAAMSAPVEVKKISLGDLVEAYRADQKKTVKASTYARNYFVGNTILSIFGETTLVSKMSAKYIKDELSSSGKDAGTLNELLLRFKAMMRWGYKNDYLNDISFLDKVEPYKDLTKREKIQDKFLESEELKTLLQSMDVDIWRAVTQFLALTGLRIGELIALNDSDVDLSDRTIHITKTFDSNNQLVTTTKTMTSTRDIFIQDELVPVIKNIKILMLQQKLLCGYDKSDLFICSPSGTYMKYDAYRKYLREKSQKVLGRSITPHALRHTHASLLLENGITVDEISRRLGHEDSKVTRDIYLHITEKLKEKENEKLRNLKII